MRLCGWAVSVLGRSWRWAWGAAVGRPVFVLAESLVEAPLVSGRAGCLVAEPAVPQGAMLVHTAAVLAAAVARARLFG